MGISLKTLNFLSLLTTRTPRKSGRKVNSWGILGCKNKPFSFKRDNMRRKIWKNVLRMFKTSV